jgi:hypothetical protein
VREGKEESSFFEKKEAKKLLILGTGCADSRLQTNKVFLLLFVHKKKILPF